MPGQLESLKRVIFKLERFPRERFRIGMTLICEGNQKNKATAGIVRGLNVSPCPVRSHMFYTQIRRTRYGLAPFEGTYSTPIRYHCRHLPPGVTGVFG